MYTFCLFDFDYTLGDSTDAVVASVNYALTSMGYEERTRDEIRRTIGMSLPETFTHLTQNGEEARRTAFRTLFMEKADQVMTDMTELLPDSIPVLTHLKDKGFTTGIVTTKYHYRIDDILAKFGIGHLVDIIVGGDDVKNNKPHPEALLTAMDRLQAAAGDILYIGDSVIDAETARGAGVDFVAVTTGTTSKEAFERYPKLAVIDRLEQLIDGTVLPK